MSRVRSKHTTPEIAVRKGSLRMRPPLPIASFRPAGKIRSYRNDRRILSLMIEVNRRIYMDEQSGLKKPEFEQASALIGKLIATAAESVD